MVKPRIKTLKTDQKENAYNDYLKQGGALLSKTDFQRVLNNKVPFTQKDLNIAYQVVDELISRTHEDVFPNGIVVETLARLLGSVETKDGKREQLTLDEAYSMTPTLIRDAYRILNDKPSPTLISVLNEWKSPSSHSRRHKQDYKGVVSESNIMTGSRAEMNEVFDGTLYENEDPFDNFS